MSSPSTPTLLHIDASMRHAGSVSRGLSDRLVRGLAARTPDLTVLRRDLADGMPLIDEAWIGANFTDPAERSPAQREVLAESDALVAELRAADILVIGLPVYNFGVPAALKAWIDLVARARETFRYTEDGPEGLLTGKRAIVAVASGGTEIGSQIDFATTYLRHMLGFLGITEVEVVAAEQVMMKGDDAVAEAEAEADRLVA